MLSGQRTGGGGVPASYKVKVNNEFGALRKQVESFVALEQVLRYLGTVDTIRFSCEPDYFFTTNNDGTTPDLADLNCNFASTGFLWYYVPLSVHVGWADSHKQFRTLPLGGSTGNAYNSIDVIDKNATPATLETIYVNFTAWNAAFYADPLTSPFFVGITPVQRIAYVVEVHYGLIFRRDATATANTTTFLAQLQVETGLLSEPTSPAPAWVITNTETYSLTDEPNKNANVDAESVPGSMYGSRLLGPYQLDEITSITLFIGGYGAHSPTTVNLYQHSWVTVETRLILIN